MDNSSEADSDSELESELNIDSDKDLEKLKEQLIHNLQYNKSLIDNRLGIYRIKQKIKDKYNYDFENSEQILQSLINNYDNEYILKIIEIIYKIIATELKDDELEKFNILKDNGFVDFDPYGSNFNDFNPHGSMIAKKKQKKK